MTVQYALLEMELLNVIMKSERDYHWLFQIYIPVIVSVLLLVLTAHTLLRETTAEAESAKWTEVRQIHSSVLSTIINNETS